MCKTRLSPLKRSVSAALAGAGRGDWGMQVCGRDWGNPLRVNFTNFCLCVCFVLVFDTIFHFLGSALKLLIAGGQTQQVTSYSKIWEKSFRAVLCWKAHRPAAPVVYAGAVGHHGGRVAAPLRPSVCYNITQMAQNLWTSITLGTNQSSEGWRGDTHESTYSRETLTSNTASEGRGKQDRRPRDKELCTCNSSTRHSNEELAVLCPQFLLTSAEIRRLPRIHAVTYACTIRIPENQYRTSNPNSELCPGFEKVTSWGTSAGQFQSTAAKLSD